jgi:hypothetical protein
MNDNKPKNKRLTLTESEKQLISVIRQLSDRQCEVTIVCDEFTSLIQRVPDLQQFVFDLRNATRTQLDVLNIVEIIETISFEVVSFDMTNYDLITDYKIHPHEN